MKHGDVMAEQARSIPRKTKEKLIHEAGGKCANPGCDNRRLQVHHIKHWAIYKTHDDKHMIALCPSCHDACHFGNLKISDDQLYDWKGIEKNDEYSEAHLFVASSKSTLISAGTLALQQRAERRTIVFELSNKNKFEFSVKDEYLSVSTTLYDMNDKIVLQITNNNIKVHSDSDIKLENRPGIFRATVPLRKFYLPANAFFLMRQVEPGYGADGMLVAIELEVISPGHVRIQGFWPNGNSAIVITKTAIHFCRSGYIDRTNHSPISLVGGGDSTVIVLDGPVNEGSFQFG